MSLILANVIHTSAQVSTWPLRRAGTAACRASAGKKSIELIGQQCPPKINTHPCSVVSRRPHHHGRRHHRHRHHRGRRHCSLRVVILAGTTPPRTTQPPPNPARTKAATLHVALEPLAIHTGPGGIPEEAFTTILINRPFPVFTSDIKSFASNS